MSRNRRAAIAALAMALAVAPVASAATVTESLAVNGTITVTGVPATLDYGAVDAGGTTATFTIDAVVDANTGWGVDITGLDFVGAGTIDKSARHVILSTNPANNGIVVFDAPSTDRNFGDASLTDATDEATGPAGVDMLVRGEYHLVVPADAPAGSYTSTLTYDFTAY